MLDISEIPSLRYALISDPKGVESRAGAQMFSDPTSPPSPPPNPPFPAAIA